VAVLGLESELTAEVQGGGSGEKKKEENMKVLL
jgi:hypothetical protein